MTVTTNPEITGVQTGGGGGGITDGDKGDIVVSGSGTIWTVDQNGYASAPPAILDAIPFVDASNSNANAKATMLAMMQEFLRCRHRYMFHFHTDFIQETSTTATDQALFETNSGTGAATSTGSTNGTSRIGAVRMSTGTTSTGRANLATAASAILLGGGEAFFEAELKIPTLSNSSEEFEFYFGFGDNASGNPTDGVYFIYDRTGGRTGTPSDNWQIATAAASVRTFATTSVAVPTDTYQRFTIIVNAAATSAEFFINGTSVGTISTNLPNNGSTHQTGFFFQIIKGVGTTARNADLDCCTVTVTYTTPRS